ncbi:MAG: hypothetical protein ACNYPG_03935 [Candidatus Porifericomitaceae bacterium WSBS_2022_MAG_OTU9]
MKETDRATKYLEVEEQIERIGSVDYVKFGGGIAVNKNSKHSESKYC